ncbi:hypothetical protein PR048_025483 [Dryococelus australis]|uniref:Uncharacterized protein n=1 Tax=Dryococelus australis TaxID=614101 RepID=A0ABQ9GRG0_9NEOP|nr:hypothetical protein PR048_025483 [Dryococelus australis]
MYYELLNAVMYFQLEAYNMSKDWTPVKQYLKDLLNEQSSAYKQLQGTDHHSPMYTIGTRGFEELATVLVMAGRGVGVCDSDGNTMLHGAAESDYLRLGEFLLAHGADPNQSNAVGYTPLMRTAWFNHLQFGELLLRSGAGVNTSDSNGDTSLHRAAYRGHLDMVRLLVEAGADTAAAKNDGATIMDNARHHGRTAVVCYLSMLPSSSRRSTVPYAALR